MEAVVATIGLITCVNGVVLLGLGLVVWRQQQQIRMVGASLKAMADAVAAATGARVHVSPELVGEPPDVIAPDEDWISQVTAGLAPWEVKGGAREDRG